ncbi:MAG TPA: Lrp/AsnC family transcriptional regulator [archaeon]|nr:Lrp/AsnC family transcriptional regulator [archaeon]
MAHKHELRYKFLKSAYQNGLVSTNSTIEKDLGITRETTRYLLERLKQEGYYSDKRLEINTARLGLNVFAWVFVSINWESMEEKEFIRKTISHSYVHTIAKVTGEYDFAIKIFGPSMQKLNSFLMVFEKSFTGVIQDITVIYAITEFKRHYSIVKKTKKAELKKIDCVLIEEKNKNPEKSLMEIAKEQNLHRNTVANRWNKLWKEEIILKESIDLTDKGVSEIKMNLKCFITIKSRPGNELNVIRELVKLDSSQDVFLTLSNLVVVVNRLENSLELATFHKKIMSANKYIRKTNTILFLEKKSRNYLTKEELRNILGVNCGK